VSPNGWLAASTSAKGGAVGPPPEHGARVHARNLPIPESALVGALLLLLLVLILYPLARVVAGATLEDGWPSPRPVAAFLARPLLRAALVNTLLSGGLSVLFGGVMGVTLAILITRYRFRGRRLVAVLAALPLAIPPFAGAAALQHVLGAGGPVNLFLLERVGRQFAFTEGLGGVILVQTLHCFPLVMLSTAAGLAGLEPALEEAARGLGASGLLPLRRVLLPLAFPGFAVGALLSFVLVMDDVATPLVLDYPRLLAPQIYARLATRGLGDAESSVACAILAALSLAALWTSRAVRARGASPGSGRGEPVASPLGRRGVGVAWLLAVALLGPALLPLVGLVALSLSAPSAAFTLGNYGAVLAQTPPFLWNTIRYALLAAGADVALGAVIAWLVSRGAAPGRGWLEALAELPLAIPGIVIAAGYLHAFGDGISPGPGAPPTAPWVALVIVYATRRLPWGVRGGLAGLAALPPAVTEAAQNLGARRARVLRAIALPLTARGLIAGGLVAFAASAVDFSSTILLAPPRELAPLSYGFHLSMHSPDGRGPAAALGVLAVALVTAGVWGAVRLGGRSRRLLFRA